MPQSITSSNTGSSSSSSTTSRSRSSSISSSCSSSSFSSTYSSSSSYSLSSYGSSFRSLSDYSDTSSSSSVTSPYHHRHTRTTEPISSLFTGLSFFFDKEAFKSLNEKQRLISLVKDHSGSISLMLSKKTTHFIVDRPTPLLLSLADNPSTLTHSLLYQINNAIRLNVHVASLDFVFASIQQLTLATQHTTKFTRSITVLAPEIPLLAIDRPDEPEPATPEPTMTLAEEIVEILAIEVENQVVLDDKPPEPLPLSSMAYVPFVLSTPSRSTFEPILILEKNVECYLMSHVLPMNQVSMTREYGPVPEFSDSTTTSFDSLSYSFEESRYYSAVLSGGKESCLGQPVRETNMFGSVWSWGKNSHGQLGVGSKQTVRTPAFVPTDFISTIKQVACGDTHTAVVTTQGDVWTWGFGSSGCLGQGEFRGSKDPILVDYFSDIKINMVACGKAHTAVLTDVGTIWTWGRNDVAQLGYGGVEKTSTPAEVCEIKDAVFVACGGHNSAAITKHGYLYTMGCNAHGQRGTGKRTKYLPSPTRINFPGEVTIKFSSIGQGFMGALDINGQLYMWGRNIDYQCGLGHTCELSSPNKISSTSVITHFACGDTHAAYATEKGQVFSWGWGPVGQLGHPAPAAMCTTPQLVQGVHDARMVACGYRHTVAITGDRCKLWVWGANEVGQLGVPAFHSFDDEYEDDGDEDDEERDGESSENAFSWLSPQILESMSRVSMVACGREHTVTIIEEMYVPIQFAKDGNDEALSYWLENSPITRELDEPLLKAELCNIRDDELGTDYSLLHWATYYAKQGVLDLLAGQYMDPNITDSSGDTPLHICAERDISSCVMILLQTGGKPDLKNKLGKTPIHISVENHTTEVLRELVENSISDKSVVDEIGNTPLHYAIKLRHFDMAKYLIESAAQPQILDKSGKTALDYCTMREASYFKSIAQKNDVFISYAHVDLAFALKIKEFLESYSIKCWMDMTRLEAGSDWRLDIGNGVLSSRLILYVGSRASVVSDWCIKELHMARKHNLVIIPIWFQKVEFDSEVKSLIFGRAFLDFSDELRFTTVGKRLSKKLKYLLGIIKYAKHNPYLEIPVLTTEQLWKQLFLTVLIDSHTCIDAAATLDHTLHSSAIFSCTHNLFLAEHSPYFAQRQANLDRTWGIVFLIDNLKQAGPAIDLWWQFAEATGKHVYLCMREGDATNVNPDDLPDRALKQTSVPIFYLENITSLQQLVFFVHLAQREEFMAKQVGVMQGKLTSATNTITDNDQELQALRRRFYVE